MSDKEIALELVKSWMNNNVQTEIGRKATLKPSDLANAYETFMNHLGSYDVQK